MEIFVKCNKSGLCRGQGQHHVIFLKKKTKKDTVRAGTQAQILNPALGAVSKAKMSENRKRLQQRSQHLRLKEDINTKSTQWGPSHPSRQKKVAEVGLAADAILAWGRHLQPDSALRQEVMTNQLTNEFP